MRFNAFLMSEPTKIEQFCDATRCMDGTDPGPLQLRMNTTKAVQLVYAFLLIHNTQ